MKTFVMSLVMISMVTMSYAVQPKVKTGIEVLVNSKLDLIKGKKVGLITNPTAVDSKLQFVPDILASLPDVKLVALFGPEHGVRGDAHGGVFVSSYTDTKTNIPVYSLYGKISRPTPAMLEGVDILMFDVQDVGARYYTYINTMANAMKAAKMNNVEFMVLDRPNPIGGISVEGPILEPKFSSGIGMYPIALTHGMTVGELAQYFNTEFKIGVKLTVIPMEGWTRDMYWEDTGLEWINTSPNVPTPDTAMVYPCVGFLGELHIASEGVGTTKPFEYLGAPWVDAEALASELNSRKLPGVYFRPAHYIPSFHIFAKQEVHGVQVHVLDKKVFKPVETGINILSALKKLYPDKMIYPATTGNMFTNAMGTDKVSIALEASTPVEEIVKSWQADLDKFLKTREQYLIYK